MMDASSPKTLKLKCYHLQHRFSIIFHVTKHTVLEPSICPLFLQLELVFQEKRNDSHNDITCLTQDSHHTGIQFKCFVGYSPFSFCCE